MSVTDGGSSAPVASRPVVGPSAAPLLTFRPDIEGLRAVAVVLVVVLHFGVTAVSGGYIGVDVFFVISGFLITSLLIDEVRVSHRVSILGFYARRARRILPVACLVIAVTVVAVYLKLGALTGRTTAIDGQWAAGFAANFRLIRTGTDYFANSAPPSALQHFWSLAVEEQFYLVWPTVLFGLVILGRRLARKNLVLQVGLVAIVATSLYWSIHLSRINPTTAYFSPFTRAWELGAGALVAVFSVSIRRVPPTIRALATWAGLALIAIGAFTLSATTEFPGYAALLPVGGTALLMAGGIGQPTGAAWRLLGLSPLRWLGKISYSVYLWHWPVIVIAEERSATPLSNVARVVCVVITLALSVASYYLVEHPLRSSPKLRPLNARNGWERSRKALVVGAAAIAVAVAVSAYTNNRAAFAIDHASKGSASGSASFEPPSSLRTTASQTPKSQVTALQEQVQTLVQQGLALKAIPPDVSPPVLKLQLDPRYSKCLQVRGDTTVKTCTFGSVKSNRTLVMFGDSHAMQWMPALDIYGQRAGYRVVTVYKLACPIPSLDVWTTAPGAANQAYPECTTWRRNALDYIRSVHPAAVVVAFGREPTSQASFDLSTWLGGLRTTLKALTQTGARTVEISDNPHLAQDPGLCLSRPHASPADCVGDYSYRQNVDTEGPAVRALGVGYVDIEPWYCSGGRCPTVIDNRIAYRDHDHLSSQYVSDLEPLLAATFEVNGLH